MIFKCPILCLEGIVSEVDCAGHLSEHIGSLCLSSEYSDVTLIVEGHRIPAHKVILAASSDYFRALLYGGMKEANEVNEHSSE